MQETSAAQEEEKFIEAIDRRQYPTGPLSAQTDQYPEPFQQDVRPQPPQDHRSEPAELHRHEPLLEGVQLLPTEQPLVRQPAAQLDRHIESLQNLLPDLLSAVLRTKGAHQAAHRTTEDQALTVAAATTEEHQAAVITGVHQAAVMAAVEAIAEAVPAVADKISSTKRQNKIYKT